MLVNTRCVGAGAGLGLWRVLRMPNMSVWKCWDRNLARKPASRLEHTRVLEMLEGIKSTFLGLKTG